MTISRTTLAVALAATILGLAASLPARAAEEASVVIELFTSQGCSSCPPADAYLGELTTRADVIALTFPVDYWDYLGWKDTLATPANTLRQQTYAARRGDGQVYTPQMVIDGQVDAVGSRRSQVEDAIASLKTKKAGQWVPVKVMVKGDAVMVTAEGHESARDQSATLWLAMFTREARVAIRRGENSGREITYHNVVRQMMPIGRWSGEPVSIELPKSDIMGQGYDGCVVILQTNGTGPIIGAGLIDDWLGN
jgi:hypothetical protein